MISYFLLICFLFSIEQNDPALNSIEFEKVLLENEREAVIQTEKVC